jgi:DNA-directed RNA polymerase subunit RPC12/RpoP
VKYCTTCGRTVPVPDTREMSKYAAYWRDNRCPRCRTVLMEASPDQSVRGTARVSEAHSVPAASAHGSSPDREEQNSLRRLEEIRWEIDRKQREHDRESDELDRRVAEMEAEQQRLERAHGLRAAEWDRYPDPAALQRHWWEARMNPLRFEINALEAEYREIRERLDRP